MNKNKEKEIVRGRYSSRRGYPINTWPARASLKPSIPSSSRKRKVATRAVGKSNLTNCHNPKK